MFFFYAIGTELNSKKIEATERKKKQQKLRRYFKSNQTKPWSESAVQVSKKAANRIKHWNKLKFYDVIALKSTLFSLVAILLEHFYIFHSFAHAIFWMFNGILLINCFNNSWMKKDGVQLDSRHFIHRRSQTLPKCWFFCPAARAFDPCVGKIEPKVLSAK